ncbi:hypothetical protein VTL71DRAFT_15692 [Oculimacula yallundae]|uniref:Uncharacterized protein n=1 Tax=Oculimacula yallundae TaxID=86028 RepID=A0ABR4CHA1_9HELO
MTSGLTTTSPTCLEITTSTSLPFPSFQLASYNPLPLSSSRPFFLPFAPSCVSSLSSPSSSSSSSPPRTQNSNCVHFFLPVRKTWSEIFPILLAFMPCADSDHSHDQGQENAILMLMRNTHR